MKSGERDQVLIEIYSLPPRLARGFRRKNGIEADNGLYDAVEDAAYDAIPKIIERLDDVTKEPIRSPTGYAIKVMSTRMQTCHGTFRCTSQLADNADDVFEDTIHRDRLDQAAADDANADRVAALRAACRDETDHAILNHLSDGLTPPAIAGLLNVAPSTITRRIVWLREQLTDGLYDHDCPVSPAPRPNGGRPRRRDSGTRRHLEA